MGLGSIILLGPLALFGNEWILSPGGLVPLLTLCVNIPHFMASYRIVYRTRESVARYKGATIFVPAVLLIYGAFAVYKADQTSLFIDLMNMVASVYLAWHYTGQVWGMMATFAFLGGKPFSPRERLLIRTGLRMLLAWHVTWAFHVDYMAPGTVVALWVDRAYWGLSLLSLVSAGFVLSGLMMYRRRTGALPPWRSIVAWVALCFWYGAMARDPHAIFWVQIAHAVQYLSFPIRVEINTLRRKPGRRHVPILPPLLLYLGALIGVGWVIETLAWDVGVPIVASFWGGVSGSNVPEVVLSFINIHHYFTDGCIWKMSSPTVREDLFAHLKE